jgi:DNA-binding CsgD family transcriptional regulator
MLSQEKVLSLIGRIYDAAADETLWPAFLEDFANFANGAGTALVYHDMTALRGYIAISVRNDPECELKYLEYYGGFDALREAWLERFKYASPEGVVASEALVDWTRLHRTEYFNDFIERYDIVHQVSAPITVNAKWASIFTCMRPRKKGPFSSDIVNVTRTLWPHLHRAMKVRRKFTELEGRHRASLGALNQLPTGVILMDDNGRILEMNRAAEQILAQNDGLVAEKEGLAGSTANATKEIRSKVTAAALTARGTGISAGGLIRVERPSGKRPFSLVVMPVSRLAFSPDGREPAAMVFVTDPETKSQTAPEALAHAFHLTPAESRLAELLMHGETLVCAAERLGVSHNTARTHLQKIYQKTNTSHQGELIRVLISLPSVSDPQP